jgi:hypothetical protein
MTLTFAIASAIRTIATGTMLAGTTCDLLLEHTAGQPDFQTGGNLCIFYDIRQYRVNDHNVLPEGGIEVQATRRQ